MFCKLASEPLDTAQYPLTLGDLEQVTSVFIFLIYKVLMIIVLALQVALRLSINEVPRTVPDTGKNDS